MDNPNTCHCGGPLPCLDATCEIGYAATRASDCDRGVEILRATNDGNDLSPVDLKLVELAANGKLSDAGRVAFADLYERARAPGGYHPPWFHGIEHLTHTHDGYVKWRGVEVEHFDHGYAGSPAGKESAEEVARRCRLLEARGETPTTDSVIWNWRGDGLSTERKLAIFGTADVDEALLARYERSLHDCKASLASQAAAVAICEMGEIRGATDPCYIANVINDEHMAARAAHRVCAVYSHRDGSKLDEQRVYEVIVLARDRLPAPQQSGAGA